MYVLVTAPEEVRVTRLVASGKYTLEEAGARMASQAGDRDRSLIADWTVYNGAGLDESYSQVKRIYDSLVRDKVPDK